MQVFSSVFSIKFQKTFSTEQQWTGTLELKKWRCKYWSSIVLFEPEITSENTNFDFLIFVKLLLGIISEGYVWLRKSNKNIAFVKKEKKHFFLRNQGVLEKLFNKRSPKNSPLWIELMSRTSYVEQFPMLSSTYYENNICFFSWLCQLS